MTDINKTSGTDKSSQEACKVRRTEASQGRDDRRPIFKKWADEKQPRKESENN